MPQQLGLESSLPITLTSLEVTHLLEVNESVHATENNVIYSQIPWKVGYRLGVIFQTNRTSAEVSKQGGI